MDCWNHLGIEETADKRAIKRAYAALLKKCNPEEHPREFQELREAYDDALEIAGYLEREAQEERDEIGASQVESAQRRPDASHVERSENGFSQTEFGRRDSEQAQAEHTQAEQAQAEQVEPVEIDPAEIDIADSSPPARPQRREREEVRELQATRIEAAVANFLALAQQDQATAIAALQATLKDDFFLALDVRYELEGQLIQTLSRGNPPSFALLDALAREFSWEIDIDNPRMVVSHFANDHRYQHAFYVLAWTYVEHLAKQAMRKRLQLSFPKVTRERFDELDALLFVDAPAESLEEYCKQDRNRALLRSACSFLVDRRFITNRGSIVPHATLQWLIDHEVLPKSKPGSNEASEPPVAEEKSSRVNWWWIGIGCFILLRLLSSLSDISNPTSKTASNYQTRINSASKYNDERSGGSASSRAIAEVAKLQRDATKGDAEAQYQLGRKYTTGYQHLAKDMSQAAKWFRSAAEQGHEKAQEEAGILYYTGRGVNRNYATAVEFLAPAAEREQSDAMYWMSRAYRDGNGAKRDTTKANQLLNRSADLGSAEGMREKGMRLIIARAKKGDLAAGEELLKKAVEKDSALASYQLALEYLSGKRLQGNFERGYELIKSLSDKNYPIAQYWESQLLDKGIGVQKDALRAVGLKTQANRDAPPSAVNDFALQMSIFPERSLRNPDLAIELMEKLLSKKENENADHFDTLAAAYAEAGRFKDAVQAQEKALAQFPKDGSKRERDSYEARLSLYKEERVPRSD